MKFGVLLKRSTLNLIMNHKRWSCRTCEVCICLLVTDKFLSFRIKIQGTACSVSNVAQMCKSWCKVSCLNRSIQNLLIMSPYSSYEIKEVIATCLVFWSRLLFLAKETFIPVVIIYYQIPFAAIVGTVSRAAAPANFLMKLLRDSFFFSFIGICFELVLLWKLFHECFIFSWSNRFQNEKGRYEILQSVIPDEL